MVSWVREELEKIGRAGLMRKTVPVERAGPGRLMIDGRSFVDFASNDYLGLSCRQELIQACEEGARKWGCGSRASRLMSGTLELFHHLEEKTARFKGTEASLCLGNGYIANSTMVPALVGPRDVVFLDRLCHASIVDGVLLSGARFFRFSHNDPTDLERLLAKYRKNYRRSLIIIETLYSMDGDIAPIRQITELKSGHNSMLMVDEAHALGIFGPYGEGIISRREEKKPEVIVGTFGKALGSYGAFAACSTDMKTYLINRCRGFIFSTALPPSVISADIKALEILPGTSEKRKKVLELAGALRNFITKSLNRQTKGQSQIVPLILSDLEETVALERFLFENGVFTRSIRPPTVPKNAPRIRFSITADHTERDMEKLQALLLKFFSAT